MADIIIKEALRSDIGVISEFIHKLAKYEKMENDVVADEKTLEREIFDKGGAHVFLAQCEAQVCGFALWFYNFSTFLGRRGIYLEDLYVDDAFRSKGVGSALLRELAATAMREGCGRLEWSCLDWNEPSIKFYKSKGAVPMDGWTVFRVSGDALENLASQVTDK